MDWSLIDELAKSEEDSLINTPEVAHPASTAIQISLVKYLINSICSFLLL